MMLPKMAAVGLPLAVTIALSLAACSAPPPDAASTSEAYTVEGGDRFLVSAVPGTVVLKKEEGGRAFPFAPDELRGKAILIHPIKQKLETGLYARAVSVAETDTTYVITTEPLLFEEMENIAESNIVRIYIDRALPKPDGAVTAALGPRSFAQDLGIETNLRPSAWGGLITGELAVEGEISNFSVAPRAKVWQESGSLSMKPKARAGWKRGRGLELGFDMSYSWSSTLAFEGELTAGYVFETPKVRTPRVVVVVPIGPVPVPVTLGLAGSFECRAGGGASIKGKVRIEVAASFGGSSFLRPSVRTPPSQWVTPGAWPWHASGRASVKPEGELTIEPGASLECAVPRIDLETLVAGVAGPYLTLAPTVSVGTEGLGVGVEIKAGLEAEFFGREAKGEVTLMSWKPD